MTLSDTHLPNTQPHQLWKRAGDIRAHLKRQCVYSSQPQAWHVKHVWSMRWTWGGRVFFLCAPLSHGTRVKMSNMKRKGRLSQPHSLEGSPPIRKSWLWWGISTLPDKGDKEMPRGRSVLLKTKQRGRKRGRIRGGKLRAPSINWESPWPLATCQN